MAKISQREARALRAEMERLRQEAVEARRAWVQGYPGGTFIASIILPKDSVAGVAVLTARRLRHPVVAVDQANGDIHLYAVKQ